MIVKLPIVPTLFWMTGLHSAVVEEENEGREEEKYFHVVVSQAAGQTETDDTAANLDRYIVSPSLSPFNKIS